MATVEDMIIRRGEIAEQMELLRQEDAALQMEIVNVRKNEAQRVREEDLRNAKVVQVEGLFRLGKVGVKLVQTAEGRIIERKSGYGETKKVRVGQAWDVLSAEDDTLIGRVSYTMLTRERRSKGRRYVNARWESPGWRYESIRPGETRSYGFEASSKKDALERIVRDHQR